MFCWKSPYTDINSFCGVNNDSFLSLIKLLTELHNPGVHVIAYNFNNTSYHEHCMEMREDLSQVFH